MVSDIQIENKIEHILKELENAMPPNGLSAHGKKRVVKAVAELL